MVGGSTAILNEQYVDIFSKIKRNSKLPVIIFPSGPWSIVRGADAIWFMSLLNSNDPYYVIGAQTLGIGTIRRLKIEAIPMGYIIMGEESTASYMGNAKVIPYDRPEIACAFAMAAETFGMRFIYLEAGSGASKPISPIIISNVRKVVSVPIIVGGGINSGNLANQLIGAGADAIVTGNLFEKTHNTQEMIIELVEGCNQGINNRLRKAHNVI